MRTQVRTPTLQRTRGGSASSSRLFLFVERVPELKHPHPPLWRGAPSLRVGRGSRFDSTREPHLPSLSRPCDSRAGHSALPPHAHKQLWIVPRAAIGGLLAPPRRVGLSRVDLPRPRRRRASSSRRPPIRVDLSRTCPHFSFVEKTRPRGPAGHSPTQRPLPLRLARASAARFSLSRRFPGAHEGLSQRRFTPSPSVFTPPLHTPSSSPSASPWGTRARVPGYEEWFFSALPHSAALLQLAVVQLLASPPSTESLPRRARWRDQPRRRATCRGRSSCARVAHPRGVTSAVACSGDAQSRRWTRGNAEAYQYCTWTASSGSRSSVGAAPGPTVPRLHAHGPIQRLPRVRLRPAKSAPCITNAASTSRASPKYLRSIHAPASPPTPPTCVPVSETLRLTAR